MICIRKSIANKKQNNTKGYESKSNVYEFTMIFHSEREQWHLMRLNLCRFLSFILNISVDYKIKKSLNRINIYFFIYSKSLWSFIGDKNLKMFVLCLFFFLFLFLSQRSNCFIYTYIFEQWLLL